MEELDPSLPYTPVDRHTAAEFLARHEALHALIDEAVEAHDQNKLGIYQEALDALKRDNPGGGAFHRPGDYIPAVTAQDGPPVSQMSRIERAGALLGVPSAVRKRRQESRRYAEWVIGVATEIDARGSEQAS